MCLAFDMGVGKGEMALLQNYKGPFTDGGNPASALWAFLGHLASHMNLDKIKGKMWGAWISMPSDTAKASWWSSKIG